MKLSQASLRSAVAEPSASHQNASRRVRLVEGEVDVVAIAHVRTLNKTIHTRFLYTYDHVSAASIESNGGVPSRRNPRVPELESSRLNSLHSPSLLDHPPPGRPYPAATIDTRLHTAVSIVVHHVYKYSPELSCVAMHLSNSAPKRHYSPPETVRCRRQRLSNSELYLYTPPLLITETPSKPVLLDRTFLLPLSSFDFYIPNTCLKPCLGLKQALQ